MISSPPASWDSSCSDASVSGRGLSTGPSARHRRQSLARGPLLTLDSCACGLPAHGEYR
jgi:hypothetical protein